MSACPGPARRAREVECWELFYSTDVLEIILPWINHKVDNVEEVQKSVNEYELLQRTT